MSVDRDEAAVREAQVAKALADVAATDDLTTLPPVYALILANEVERLAEQARAAERRVAKLEGDLDVSIQTGKLLVQQREAAERERDEFKASFMRENEAALDFQIKMLAAEQRAEQYAEALTAIERMAGAAGSGEIAAMPIAQRARRALAPFQEARDER